MLGIGSVELVVLVLLAFLTFRGVREAIVHLPGHQQRRPVRAHAERDLPLLVAIAALVFCFVLAAVKLAW